MTGGPPAPSRHPSSRPSSLPPSISLECPDGDSAVTPHLSIPVRQMPWTQAAAKKPASSSFSFSADPGGSGRWPSGPRVAQVLLSAERLGAVRPRLSALPRRPGALVWPALPLKCDVCIRSHFEPQPGLVEGDTCGRAPPPGFLGPSGQSVGPPTCGEPAQRKRLPPEPRDEPAWPVWTAGPRREAGLAAAQQQGQSSESRTSGAHRATPVTAPFCPSLLRRFC